VATFAGLQERVSRIISPFIPQDDAVWRSLPSSINGVITRMQEYHQFKIQEAEANLVTTLSTRLLGALPTDWLRPRSRPYLRTFNGTYIELDYEMDATIVQRQWSTVDQGEPRIIEETTTGFNVWPLSDASSDYVDTQYRVNIPYWKYLPALASGTDTNWFSVNAETAVAYAASGELCLLIPGLEAQARAWRLNPGWNRQPLSIADEEYKRLVGIDKARWFGTRQNVFVFARDTRSNRRTGRL
jgi:hypothetical protein